MSSSWWWDRKGQVLIKVLRILPGNHERLYMLFYVNPSNSCCDISVCIKMVDQPTKTTQKHCHVASVDKNVIHTVHIKVHCNLVHNVTSILT